MGDPTNSQDPLPQPAYDRFMLLCELFRYRYSGHWTGHPSKLDRDLAHPFGSVGYTKEELRGEISFLMTGDQLGIGHDPGQHSTYVKCWIVCPRKTPRRYCAHREIRIRSLIIYSGWRNSGRRGTSRSWLRSTVRQRQGQRGEPTRRSGRGQ